jgi:protein-tyrosine phosphatase
MLKDNHGDNFMIYNLSERPYDYGKFNNQVRSSTTEYLLILYKVHEWCGFPDHHAPPLAKLFQILKSIHSWLLADPKNVVVVHCLVN